MKKQHWILGIVVVVLVFVVATLGHYGEFDCENQVRDLRNNVEFPYEDGHYHVIGIDNGGRCDGVCMEWHWYGCEIADDQHSWLVMPWGGVIQTE